CARFTVAATSPFYGLDSW
nr:immunoglobulin heavy chain junction region [Macaca mulatta]